MLVLSSIGFVEGRSADLSGRTLTEALRQAASDGEPTLLSLLKAVPGQRLTLDLGRTRQLFNRMLRQRQQAESLLAVTPAVSPPVSPPLSPPLAPAVSATSTARAEAGRNVNRRIVTLPVPHRPDPLEITLLEPASGANGRLVLISHGLWDSPAAFEGWGILLASRGYNVALPRHPGSDSSQQEAVLTGQSPPPGPGRTGAPSQGSDRRARCNREWPPPLGQAGGCRAGGGAGPLLGPPPPCSWRGSSRARKRCSNAV